MAKAIPPLLKRLNERTVLETIRAGAPISRAEISRRAGISKPTVSLALQSLLDAGLVREIDHDPGGLSYGAVFFEPVPDAALVLGLDLGARFLRGAVCDLGGQIRARHDVELLDVDVGSALEAIRELHNALVKATGLPDDLIDGAVVGVPGVVDVATGHVHLTSFPGLDGLAFGSSSSSRSGSP
jgi:DNA-binding transcriptional ArsR family regulator